MEEYKAMYTRLFNGMTDIIEALEALQRETEEMFISAGVQESAKSEGLDKRKI